MKPGLSIIRIANGYKMVWYFKDENLMMSVGACSDDIGGVLSRLSSADQPVVKVFRTAMRTQGVSRDAGGCLIWPTKADARDALQACREAMRTCGTWS